MITLGAGHEAFGAGTAFTKIRGQGGPSFGAGSTSPIFALSGRGSAGVVLENLYLARNAIGRCLTSNATRPRRLSMCTWAVPIQQVQPSLTFRPEVGCTKMDGAQIKVKPLPSSYPLYFSELNLNITRGQRPSYLVRKMSTLIRVYSSSF
jgi:hypothetical protein